MPPRREAFYCWLLALDGSLGCYQQKREIIQLLINTFLYFLSLAISYYIHHIQDTIQVFLPKSEYDYVRQMYGFTL